MTIRAVGFDIDHTLAVDNRLEFTVAVEMIGADRRADVESALSSYRTGKQTMDEAMSAIGVDPQRFRRRVLERAASHIRCVAGAKDVLRTIRERGIPAAILSNGWSPLQEIKAQVIGFAGPVLVSDVIGASKPSRSAFTALRDALDVPADAIAYVGDDPAADVAGAIAAGMTGVWFDWEGRTYPQDGPPASLTIHALVDVLRVLPGPLFDVANRPL